MQFRLLISSHGFLVLVFCAGSFSSAHSHGVAVLYRRVSECWSAFCEFDGHFVLVELAFCGAVFREACIYAPNCNPDCDDCFVHYGHAIDPAVPTLLCGDFYTVFDHVVDRRELGPF